MFSKIAAAASMASLALAYPPSAPTTGTAGQFTMIAIHSGDIDVHLRPITASGGELWLGKDTASYCPSGVVDCDAYPGTQTVVGADSTGGSASMVVGVPGGQQLYVTRSGGLAYTQAHSANIPEDAIRTPFTYTAPAQPGSVGSLEGPGGFYACPTGDAGVYQIKADVDPALTFFECTGIAIGASPAQTNAWQYT